MMTHFEHRLLLFVCLCRSVAAAACGGGDWRRRAALNHTDESCRGRFNAPEGILSTSSYTDLCNGTTRAQLPTVAENDIFDIYFVDGPTDMVASESEPAKSWYHNLLPGLYHADLVFMSKTHDISFGIGWFILGSFVYGGPGMVAWYPHPCTDPGSYFGSYTKTRIGSVRGKILNDLLDWAVRYGERRPHYVLFGVANQGLISDSFDEMIEANDCGDFLADLIEESYKRGAEIDTEVLICKPYFTVIAKHVTLANGLEAQRPDILEALKKSSFKDFLNALHDENETSFSLKAPSGQLYEVAPKSIELFYPVSSEANYQRAILSYQPASEAKVGECRAHNALVFKNSMLPVAKRNASGICLAEDPPPTVDDTLKLLIIRLLSMLAVGGVALIIVAATACFYYKCKLVKSKDAEHSRACDLA